VFQRFYEDLSKEKKRLKIKKFENFQGCLERNCVKNNLLPKQPKLSCKRSVVGLVVVVVGKEVNRTTGTDAIILNNLKIFLPKQIAVLGSK
jgi:hypothetical protein